MRSLSRAIGSLLNVIGVILICIGVFCSFLNDYFYGVFIESFISREAFVNFTGNCLYIGVLLWILAIMFKHSFGTGVKVFLVLFVRRLLITLLFFVLWSCVEIISSVALIYSICNLISWVIAIICCRKIIKNI